jgi:uncharacterized membrane protein YfcA
MTADIILLYGLFFAVAFLYAAVGHGGASGYLALMALYAFAPEVMKPTALLLNIFVSLVAFIQFYNRGHFKFNIFLPLAIASIPLAFAGGLIQVPGSIYKPLLAIFLVVAALRFFIYPNKEVKELHPISFPLSLLIGGGIGFASGLLGIGGGILLSPLLLLLQWTNQKQTAAISALFIFVNSLSGLAGQITTGIRIQSEMMGYFVMAFSGGIAGAYLGAGVLNQKILKYLLAVVLLIAALKLLLT